MTARCGGTEVFVPMSAVKKEECNPAPAYQYNNRLAAQKQQQQQQLGGHDQPFQTIEYYRQMAQLQDRNEIDKPHGNGIVTGEPNVHKQIKSNPAPLLSDHHRVVSGHPKRRVVHDYEPIPGPAPSIKSQNSSDKETTVQELPMSNTPYHTPAIVDENPYNLEIGSLIEFSNPPHFGIIKWIGYISDISKKFKMAGLEMVNAIVI